MSREALVWAWVTTALGILVIGAQILSSAVQGTFLLFSPYPDGPSWATVGVAVVATIAGVDLWQHYRRSGPDAGREP